MFFHWRHLRDSTFHRLLFLTIALLGSLVVYYRFFNYVPDPLKDDFDSKISKYDLELGLQNKPEAIKPNSVKVPILIYHSVRPHLLNEDRLLKYYTVAPEAFEEQMQYLKDHHYVVLGLDFLAEALEQNISLPDKSIVITLDDGWRNQYANAFPILKKFGYTATFFIIAGTIDSPHFFSWDQVRVMNNSGMTIGDHTLTHPYIPDISNLDQLRREIISSKHVIEDQIGTKVNLFAYPYGHYTDLAISIIKEAGYTAARSTYKGIYNSKGDMYTLKGIEVTDDLSKFVSDINK